MLAYHEVARRIAVATFALLASGSTAELTDASVLPRSSTAGGFSPIHAEVAATSGEASKGNDEDPSTTRKKKMVRLAAAALAVVTLVAVISAVVVVKKQTSSTASASGPSATTAPTTPTNLLGQQHVKSLLPDCTLQAMDEDPNSPQTKALEFSTQDPNWESYPEWRSLQRFALATLFFATNGDRWEFTQGWLDYNVHECEWYAGPGGQPIDDKDTSSPICEEDSGIYKHLRLPSNRLRGPLPVEVFVLLPHLETIALPQNNLLRALPTEIGQLSTSLNWLDLGDNSNRVGIINKPDPPGSLH